MSAEAQSSEEAPIAVYTGSRAREQSSGCASWLHEFKDSNALANDSDNEDAQMKRSPGNNEDAQMKRSPGNE